MIAGVDQLTVGVAWLTVRFMCLFGELKSTVSFGTKFTESCCVPAAKTVPAAGEYVKVPATVVVASSCVAPSAVPYVMGDGTDHVIVGVTMLTVIFTFLLTVL